MAPDRNPDATRSSYDVRYRPPVVRTRSRSHASHLTLAALGLMAGMVALASDPRPTTPVEASTAADVPSSAIREIDFTELPQPGSACAEGLDGSAPAAIGVDRGASDLLDPETVTRLEVDDAVTYGDLDGDGKDEAVVHVVCLYGANGEQDTVQVWTVDRGQRRLVDRITAAPTTVAAGSEFPPAVHAVAVDGDEVVVTFTRHAADDPHCCPSQQTEVRYRLDRGDLEAVGRAVSGPLEG
jgi:LppP/LprE lipoprotein